VGIHLSALGLLLGGMKPKLVALVLGVALFVAVPAYPQFFSPGELTRGHAALEGDEHCNDCHSAGSRVSNDKCLTCHEDVARTLRASSGLHGRQYKGQPCGNCHVDHRGRDQSLIRWDPKAFQHAQTGWTLVGAHARLECNGCHKGTNARGHKTFIGLSAACTSCHKDPHENRFGTACQSCHDQENWRTLELDRFDHDLARFDLRGKHQKVACAKCHGEPPKYQPLSFGDCDSCHKDPHAGRFTNDCASCHVEASWQELHMKRSDHPGLSLAAGHARVDCRKCHDRGNMKAPSRGERCESCHKPVHEARFGTDCKDCHAQIRWVGLSEQLGRRVHDKTPFALHGKHEAVDCKGCHLPALPRAKRYRRLRFEACADCHKDVHRGQFGDAAQSECGRCHTDQGFAPASFGVELHAATDFALSGRHEAVACGACHTGPRPRLQWQVTQQACADCHKNPHGEQFAREMEQNGCATCHTSSDWNVPNIKHDTWPLTGAHQKVACDQCHSVSEAERKAGSGVSYRAAPRECEGCHDDVHLGQFRLTNPVKTCGECHATSSFKLPGFQHAERTGYALEGKHALLKCAQCHGAQELQNGAKTARWRLPYDDCKDCHADPHAGGSR
jgi:hypothetical protein